MIFAKLNLKSLLENSIIARENIAKLPKWEQDAIKYVSYFAASQSSRKVLYNTPEE